MEQKQTYKEKAREHLLRSAEVKRLVAESCIDSLVAAAEIIANRFKAGGKLLLCGNGGSAADCQHVAAEFVNRLTKDLTRPALPAIALTTDTSFLTAFGNDCGFKGIFERQVQALGKPGDVLIGISTSGNSENVLQALKAAQTLGIHTVAVTGNGGGSLASLADLAVVVPEENTQYIQEAHLAIEHILCQLVEQHLFDEKGNWRS